MHYITPTRKPSLPNLLVFFFCQNWSQCHNRLIIIPTCTTNSSLLTTNPYSYVINKWPPKLAGSLNETIIHFERTDSTTPEYQGVIVVVRKNTYAYHSETNKSKGWIVTEKLNQQNVLLVLTSTSIQQIRNRHLNRFSWPYAVATNTDTHEIHETCNSVTVYFMSELIFWH